MLNLARLGSYVLQLSLQPHQKSDRAEVSKESFLK